MPLPVPPAPPATVSKVEDWYAWDIAIRYEDLQMRKAASAASETALATYRAAHLKTFGDEVAAIAANGQAMVGATKALDSYTDAELLHTFIGSILRDWGASSRGGPSVMATAQQMLTEYRKVVPRP